MPRLIVTVLLIYMGIGFPMGLYYRTGYQGAKQQAQDIRDRPGTHYQQQMRNLASALTLQLEQLIAAEERRPYFHYQHVYHDPFGAAKGEAVSISPLANGPTSNWIHTHCSINSIGDIRVPTLDQFGNNDNNRKLVPIARQQREKLSEALAHIHADGRPISAFEMAENAPKPQSATNAPITSVQLAQVNDIGANAGYVDNVAEQVEGDDEIFMAEQQDQVAPNSSLRSQQALAPQRNPVAQVQSIEPIAYNQNIQAEQIFAKLKYEQQKVSPVNKGGKGGKGSYNPKSLTDYRNYQGQSDAPLNKPVDVVSYPMRWQRILWEDKPALFALRIVTLAEDTLAQGFLVNPSAIASFISVLDVPLRMSDEPLSDHINVPIKLDRTRWYLSASIANAQSAANVKAAAVTDDFLQRFSILAMLCVVIGHVLLYLMWRSIRLAQQRSTLAASAAHELRTPLAGLQMYSEMLADQLGNPDNYRRYAKRLAGESQRLGRVVSNLMSFTRLERGKLNYPPEPMDLTDFLRQWQDNQGPILDQQGVSVSATLPEHPAMVMCHRDAMDQIVQNLVDNAEKYSREAGERRIDIYLAVGDDAWHLSVRDRGPGFAAGTTKTVKHWTKAFTRGSQADAPAGLGLGLTMVDALVDTQGATLHLGNHPDGGALVSVIFKAA